MCRTRDELARDAQLEELQRRESSRHAEALFGPTRLALDGVEVHLCRSEDDGRLLLLVDTHDARDEDTHEESGVPRLRLMVNDGIEELDAEGEWRRDA